MTTSTAPIRAPQPSPVSAQGFTGGFTVLMAVYGRDHPHLFERALQSVYANGLPPDDFVLVVDGPVPEAITALIRTHEVVRGLRVLRLPENVGLARALNRGLGLVTTEWVVRADADDVNLPDRFEKQARASLQSDVDVFGGSIEEVDSSGRVVAVRRVPTDHGDILRTLPRRCPFNHMTVACRTTLLKRVGGYPDVYLKEDYALWGRLVAAGANCSNIPDVLVRATAGRDMYRRRGGLRYARSELHLQLFLRTLGIKNFASAVFWAALRASVFCLPAAMRGFVYERFLRDSANADSQQERHG